MEISIGSKNPVKLKASKDAFNMIFKSDITKMNLKFESVEINIPDIHNTPNSIKDMIRGAQIRAQESIKKVGSDLGVGIEGGVFTTDNGTFLTAYAVVTNSENIGIGSGPAILLPKSWKLSTEKTFELGSYVDDLTGETNTKQKNGAIGLLTNDNLTRGETLKLAVMCAYFSFQQTLS